jgi:hypothetical protein
MNVSLKKRDMRKVGTVCFTCKTVPLNGNFYFKTRKFDTLAEPSTPTEQGNGGQFFARLAQVGAAHYLISS